MSLSSAASGPDIDVLFVVLFLFYLFSDILKCDFEIIQENGVLLRLLVPVLLLLLFFLL